MSRDIIGRPLLPTTRIQIHTSIIRIAGSNTHLWVLRRWGKNLDIMVSFVGVNLTFCAESKDFGVVCCKVLFDSLFVYLMGGN